MFTPLDVRIVGNLSPPDWWTIGLTAAATIVGAVVGASIAYVVARQTAKENRAMAAAIRCEAEEAATLRAQIKLMQLVNSAAGYHLGTERGIEQARKEPGLQEVQTWLVMRSFAGKPSEMHMDADDLVAFARAKNFDFITRILFLFSMYNA